MLVGVAVKPTPLWAGGVTPAFEHLKAARRRRRPPGGDPGGNLARCRRAQSIVLGTVRAAVRTPSGALRGAIRRGASRALQARRRCEAQIYAAHAATACRGQELHLAYRHWVWTTPRHACR